MPDPVAASLRLAPEALTRPFSAEQFSFSTTNDLEPFRGVLGQERAVEALQFGVAMPRPGYNVFVMGEPGTGRFSFVKRYLKAEAKRQQTINFYVPANAEPRKPGHVPHDDLVMALFLLMRAARNIDPNTGKATAFDREKSGV